MCPSKLFLTLTAAALSSATILAQERAGDKDDQIVVTGCVTRAADVRTISPHGPFVWSKGDFYLASPVVKGKPSGTGTAVGTTGTNRLLFYWIDDDDDFARYDRHQVEVVGELSDELEKGEVEVKHRDNAVEIEFDVRNREALARIPVSWFGTRLRDNEFDVAVRAVDVEKVTVLGACAGR